MQIFVTDVDPQKCAFALDDKRVNSQVRESAQVLSAALHHIGMGAPDLYRPVAANELVVWASQCRPNFEWLFTYAYCMSEEWSCRTAKVHAAHTVIEHCGLLREGVPDGTFRTPFINATTHKDLPVIEAYRSQLLIEWNRPELKPAVWSHRQPPYWTNGRLRVERDKEGVYRVKR